MFGLIDYEAERNQLMFKVGRFLSVMPSSIEIGLAIYLCEKPVQYSLINNQIRKIIILESGAYLYHVLLNELRNSFSKRNVDAIFDVNTQLFIVRSILELANHHESESLDGMFKSPGFSNELLNSVEIKYLYAARNNYQELTNSNFDLILTSFAQSINDIIPHVSNYGFVNNTKILTRICLEEIGIKK